MLLLWFSLFFVENFILFKWAFSFLCALTKYLRNSMVHLLISYFKCVFVFLYYSINILPLLLQTTSEFINPVCLSFSWFSIQRKRFWNDLRRSIRGHQLFCVELEILFSLWKVNLLLLPFLILKISSFLIFSNNICSDILEANAAYLFWHILVWFWQIWSKNLT